MLPEFISSNWFGLWTEIYRVYFSISILIIFAVHYLCWSLLQWLHCPLGHHWVWCVWHINGLSKLAVIYFVANIDCIYIYQDVVILVEYLVCHICWKGLIDTTRIYDTHRRIKNLFYLYGDTIMAPSIKNKFSTYSVFHEFAFLIHVSKSRKKNCCTLQGDDTIQTIISVCTWQDKHSIKRKDLNGQKQQTVTHPKYKINAFI